MNVKDVAGKRFAPRRPTKQKRSFAVSPDMLRQVVIDKQHNSTFFHEILGNAGCGIRSDIDKTRRAFTFDHDHYCESIADKGAVVTESRLPIERPAPAILDRAAVNVPLQTGLNVVDALVPIGRGQRELILGDRRTGKTAIAIDAILNQKGQNVVCVYCAIGQRASAVAKVVADLQSKGSTTRIAVSFPLHS